MTDLRKEARGRECMIRYPSICLRTTETTVLAHVRLAGITGAGQKAPDVLASFSCAACHREADRQTTILPFADAKIGFYEGVLKTQYQLWKEGKITVGDAE